ncbi:MAG: acetyltransferase component of pyruvate dehydrogenase complex [Geminicoccaceae bacterium]|jgi:pyruvate dehydrogenase E2 component (dihydrolipoamide acetyltransferase)|nr:MAG: acetyltransferase component of pyruvate dehydrogenase complex [Geminicoccaceae bacterium]
MPTPILMPALSPTMTEGNLARWLKKEGDPVRPGEVIAEIETDKATMEVEAVDEGVLGKILVPAGSEGVKVNTPIALLLGEGEDPSALAGTAAPQPAAAAPAPAAPSATAPAAAPAAARPSGNGVAAPGAAAAAGAEGRIFASPLARRMAAQAGLDLRTIKGTGPGGRIVKADIEAALAAPRPTVAPAAAPPPAPAPTVTAPTVAPPAPTPAPVTPPPGVAFDEIPLNNMRKTIARRLAESKATIPHFYLTIDVRLDALLDLRAKLNARPNVDYKLSVNDFVIKAVALALRKVPDCNASFAGDRILRYRDVDVAVAVAIEGGLITPVVRRADQKTLSVISAEMKDLAARARAGKLKPEEFQGGGFTISNLGMYGIREFAAIINPPQACILAVGAGEKRPVVEGDAIVVRTLMTVTLSTDHRVVDGALGAEFLQAFKALIEDPMGLLV